MLGSRKEKDFLVSAAIVRDTFHAIVQVEQHLNSLTGSQRQQAIDKLRHAKKNLNSMLQMRLL